MSPIELTELTAAGKSDAFIKTAKLTFLTMTSISIALESAWDKLNNHELSLLMTVKAAIKAITQIRLLVPKASKFRRPALEEPIKITKIPNSDSLILHLEIMPA